MGEMELINVLLCKTIFHSNSLKLCWISLFDWNQSIIWITRKYSCKVLQTSIYSEQK
jgi:hypothetical protein